MTGKAGRNWTRGCAAVALLGLTGCVENPLSAPRFSEMFRAGVPSAQTVAPEPAPDARGVIDFGAFAVIVAQEGDTMAELANRVALTPEILARYNGLPATYLVRKGERFAIPEGGQVAAVEQGWSPAIVTSALDGVPDGAAKPILDAPANVPLRHQVVGGETVYTIAKLYGVSVTALASWNGLTGDLSVADGRSLIIPVAGAPGVVPPSRPNAQPAAQPAAAPAPAAQTPTNTPSEPGQTTAVRPPPSSSAPLPKDTTAEAAELESPNLSQFRTEASGAVKLLAPVDGKIIKPFAKGGAAKNDGIDYQTAAGAPVRAAAEGEVALVSRSLGGLGTIVLIRHPDDLITVYGRVTNVQVEKGAAIRRGQTIGSVAEGSPPTMHFEVRRGTEAVDPAPYL